MLLASYLREGHGRAPSLPIPLLDIMATIQLNGRQSRAKNGIYTCKSMVCKYMQANINY